MADFGALPDGLTPNNVGAVLIFLSDNVLSELPLPGAKQLSFILKFALEHSLALPEDHEAILNLKLDTIAQKVDALGRKLDDLTELTIVLGNIQRKVETVSAQIAFWWQRLQHANDKTVSKVIILSPLP
jgi:uncharacterized protein HemX